jgi:prephenate dehydrogenase
MEAHFTSARVLIAGLGLIGGSVAKALRDAGCGNIDGLDTDADVLASAQSDGIISGVFQAGEKLYDIVICSLAPKLVAPLYERVRKSLKPGGVFAEMSGLKSGVVCEMADTLMDGHELLCLHPMAGSEKSGYAYSDATLFRDAPLILTPTTHTGDIALGWAEFLRKALGCGDMPSIPADEHDALIADLSHLPHIAALAVRAVGKGHETYAGGSYRSVTRVADINAPLWAGLLTDNAEYLLVSIRKFREQLDALETAVSSQDAAALESLLRRISVWEDS